MMFENFINLHWLVSCLFFAGIFSNSIVFWLKDLCVWIFFLVIYFIVLIVIIARHDRDLRIISGRARPEKGSSEIKEDLSER